MSTSRCSTRLTNSVICLVGPPASSINITSTARPPRPADLYGGGSVPLLMASTISWVPLRIGSPTDPAPPRKATMPIRIVPDVSFSSADAMTEKHRSVEKSRILLDTLMIPYGIAWHLRRILVQGFQERLCRFQIGHIKALGKPVVNGFKQVDCLSA